MKFKVYGGEWTLYFTHQNINFLDQILGKGSDLDTVTITKKMY